MDKKSWPWKKKSPDKPPSLQTVEQQDSFDIIIASISPPQTSELEQQQNSEASSTITQCNTHGSPSMMSDSSQSDLNLQSISTPMITTEDIVSDSMETSNAKDELVKQHMKIAEDAIAGWERAEAEAAEIKEKLEALMEQKLATEDRVSHLDGALKECMKQLRHVREDQENKIHEAVLKNTREWEKIRTDLEEKLDDSANKICETIAENRAMAKSLQERAKTISELMEAKTRLEGENSKFQTRMASVEKENIRFKYELHSLSKEIELKNEEHENRKRSNEIATKQNMENNKKIAKLEEECQRLRLLLKKRGPVNTTSSANSLKSQGEMGIFDKSRRPSPCRRNTISVPHHSVESSGTDMTEDSLREENRILSDKVMSLEEEAKSLRELLVKKDKELQSARLRFASKQLPVNHASMEARMASVSDEFRTEDDACADPWASALISELSHFKKDSKSSISEKSLQTSISLEMMMDDFAEMERLASLSSPRSKNVDKPHRQGRSSSDNLLDCQEKQVDTEEHGLRGRNVVVLSESMDELCRELREKLADAEAQLISLKEKQSISDSTISQLEQLLDLRFNGAEGEGNGKILLSKAMDITNIAIECEKDEERKRGKEANNNHVNKIRKEGNNCINKIDCLSNKNFTANESGKLNSWTNSQDIVDEPQINASMEFGNAGAELASAVRKVLDIVEGIGRTDYNFPYSQWISGNNTENGEDGRDFDSPGKQWRTSGLDACVESLINLCNSLIQGKVDIIDFIAEVASALDWLVGLIFADQVKSSPSSSSSSSSRKCKNNNKLQIDTSDSEITCSARSSPTQMMGNGSDMEEGKTIETIQDHSSVSNLSFQFSESSTQEEDISKNSCDLSTLKLSLDTETRKANIYESEILRLKLVNEQLEHTHELTMEKLTDLGSQVHEANQRVQELSKELLNSQAHSIELQAQLQESMDKRQSMETILGDMEYAKNALESELYMAKENVESLQRKVINLEKELNEEIRCRKEANLQYLELKRENDLQKGETRMHGRNNSVLSEDNEVARLKKEQEIAAAAEKLAECQQTILDLGKQLKALGVSKNILDLPSPHNNSTYSSSEQDSAMDERQCIESDVRERYRSMYESKHKQDHGGMKSLNAIPYPGGYQEEPSTPVGKKGGQRSYGKQTQNHKSFNTYPSPTHGDFQENGQNITNPNSDPLLSSPLRSPARFLSLRSKNNNGNSHEQAKHVDNENAEKHGSSGFSRFFGRTKGGGH